MNTGWASMDQLRSEAERRLANGKNWIEPRATAGIMSKLQELEVHKLELEMQNEALLNALAEIETIRTRLQDIHDLSPAGCYTLSMEGEITELNRQGATLLGIRLQDGIGRPFRAFFHDSALGPLDEVLTTARQTRMEIPVPPLRLRRNHRLPAYVEGKCRVSADIGKDSRCVRIVLLDVSARQTATEDIVRALLSAADRPSIVKPLTRPKRP
jgi:PAS domain S-box-containing protein